MVAKFKPSGKDKPSSAKAADSEARARFAFGKENYRLMLIGIGLIFIGFLLMIGGGSKDPNVFSYDIFNFPG